MRVMRIRTSALLPGLVLLAACGDAVGSLDDEAALVSADVASFVAASTGDDLDVMTLESDEVMRPGNQMSDCNRNGFRRFVCARRSFRGSANLTIERRVTFYDVDGVEQEAYDPSTTASINFYSLLEGTREHGQMSASIAAERDFTVSGLENEETTRTWNGTGSSDRNRTRLLDGEGDRVYNMTTSTTVDNVVIAVPREGTWPLSGTITRYVRVEVIRGLEDPQVRERTVVITFNGSQFPDMTVDGERFDFDLADRKADRRGR